MTRAELSEKDREHGRRLGELIAKARVRQRKSAPELAISSAVSIDAVRSLEGGRIGTPSFLTVARLAGALGLSLDELHHRAVKPARARRGRAS
ncbi:helix-turn-helix domain-containing protein [Mycobacteroides abscessus]